MSTVLALTVTWDPTVRGILVVGTGIAVLCGSIYLLLATNTGIRLGFLIAAAGLLGWMTIMGAVWWLYGIGLVGDAPSWEVREVVASSSAEPDALDGLAALDEASDLSDWRQLEQGETARGDAESAATEALTGEDSRVKVFEPADRFVILDVFDKGGKDPDSWVSELPGPHPPHHAVVQIQKAIEVETEFGEAPPPPEPDPDEPVYSVILLRDLGNERLRPAAFTIACGLLFAVVCNVMHRRDKLLRRHQEAEEPAPT